MKSCWFEQIPVDKLSEDQLGFTVVRDTHVHLRMIGIPSCLQDVMEIMTSNTIMWMEQGFFAHDDLEFYDENCCSSLRVGRIDGMRFALHGQSHEVVAQIASFLWSLEDHEERSDFIVVNFGTYNQFDFGVVTTRQLASLFEKNPGRKTHLHGLSLSATQSSVLASQPFAIDLRLANCFFKGGDRIFVDLIQHRSNSFGSLRLPEDNPFEPGSQCRLMQFPTLGFLSICFTALENKDMLLLPFTSKVDKLKYCVDEMDNRWQEVESLTIVPKKCVLKIQCECGEFPSIFLRATGNLTEMGLVYFCAEPSRQALADLVSAVESNQRLEVLEIGYLDESWLSTWKRLMSVVSCHRGLRRLKIKIWMDFPSPHHFVLYMNDLLSMLKRNRNIDVDIVSPSKENAFIWKLCIDETIKLNRFLRGSKSLPKNYEKDRSALLGHALMKCRGRDIRRTCLLLTDNTDLLCMLLRNNEYKNRIKTHSVAVNEEWENKTLGSKCMSRQDKCLL